MCGSGQDAKARKSLSAGTRRAWAQKRVLGVLLSNHLKLKTGSGRTWRRAPNFSRQPSTIHCATSRAVSAIPNPSHFFTLVVAAYLSLIMAGGHLKYRHLSRSSAHRDALLRNLVTSLFKHESITTTWHKAKEAQRLAEKLVTLGKRNTDATRRRAHQIFFVRRLPSVPINCMLMVAGTQ